MSAGTETQEQPLRSKTPWVRRLSFIMVALCGLALISVFALRPSPPVVRFVGFGMQLDNPYYVFEMTNRLDAVISFRVVGEIQQNNKWPIVQPNDQFSLGPHQSFFIISPVHRNDETFRLAIRNLTAVTEWDQRRKTCAQWLRNNGWRKVARWVWQDNRPAQFYAPTAQPRDDLPYPSYALKTMRISSPCWIGSAHLQIIPPAP